MADSLSRRLDHKSNNVALAYPKAELKSEIERAQQLTPKYARWYKGLHSPKQSILNKEDTHQIERFKIVAKDGILYTEDGRLVVPTAASKLVGKILIAFHNDLSEGHPGQQRTQELIERHFWWEKMGDNITLYVEIM